MLDVLQKHILDALIIICLIILNGIFAMTELAIVSSSRIKMEALSKKNKGSLIALQLMEHPGSFLSTIQVGITVIGIISGVFSGQKFAEPLGLWLNGFSWAHNHGSWIAFISVITLITYISIIVGELIPKRIAISNPETIASILARPIFLVSKIVYPFVFLLDQSTKLILRIFYHLPEKNNNITEEEIYLTMKQGFKEGTINDFEHTVFNKVLQFGDREASAIMTPLINVVYLDLLDSSETNIQKILNNPHRYYPIFQGGIDNFKGIIDAKDALNQLIHNKKLTFENLVKKAPLIIEGNLGPDILAQFKKYKTHIAVVIDEYGMMKGIVTLVDIFETLVESVPVQAHTNDYAILMRDDGSWLCDGLCPIDEIETLLKEPMNPSKEFNTLAGFLLSYLNHIPKTGDYIHWHGFKFEIVDMDAARIDKVLIIKKN